VERQVGAAGVSGVTVHEGDYGRVLAACDVAAVASGTATLDAALAGLPMVVVYRVRPLTYLLGRLLVRVDHIALPNLVLGRRLVPELIQGDCTPGAVAGTLRGWLDDPAAAGEVRRALGEVRQRLARPGTFDHAAAAVLETWRSKQLSTAFS
jgi:lipid-A-disaccharide synthase